MIEDSGAGSEAPLLSFYLNTVRLPHAGPHGSGLFAFLRSGSSSKKVACFYTFDLGGMWNLLTLKYKKDNGAIYLE
jgi:hypothetical protein